MSAYAVKLRDSVGSWECVRCLMSYTPLKSECVWEREDNSAICHLFACRSHMINIKSTN